MTAQPRRRRAPSLVVTVLTLLPVMPALTGCGLYTRPTSEDREARQDCNAEADRVFAVRNRYQLSERNSSDSPYAGNTLPSNPTTGLSDQYAQDRLVDNCLARGGATPSGPAGH